MVGNALSDEEHGEVVGEVVAVVDEEVVRLGNHESMKLAIRTV